jgi:acyl transferase domain-containing protein/acyl carrier protein
LIATSAADAERELRCFSRTDGSGLVRSAFVAHHRPPRIAIVFGSSCADARSLACLREDEPVFRSTYDLLADAMPDAVSAEFASARWQIALAELWRSWGIEPSLLVGYGTSGELTAAIVAGSLSPRDAVALIQASGPASRIHAQIRPPKAPLLLESMGETVQAGCAVPNHWSPSVPSKVSDGGDSVRARSQAFVDHVLCARADVPDAVLEDLASIYLAGTAIAWGAFHSGERQASITLPNYPFQRVPLWPPEYQRAARMRQAGGAGSAAADEGLYRVEWSAVDPQQHSAIEPASSNSKQRNIVLIHRTDVPSKDARAAMEAVGLRVDTMLIGQSGVSMEDLKRLAEGRRDTQWLYVSQPKSGIDAPDDRSALEDVLAIFQTVLDVELSAPAVWIATAGAHANGGSIRPTEAGLWGLGRVLASEAPGVRVSFVDLDAHTPDWAGLAGLIAADDGDAELALAGGAALTPRLVAVDLGPMPERRLASAQASYIVTGAFGFIGELTARWLAKQGAGKLFLVGRNPPGAQAQEAIKDARAAGTEVDVVIADIGTERGVSSLFASVAADSRPLKGIIHSAGAIDDALIPQQTPARLSHAFAAKAKGAWLLHEQSVRHQLDFFVLYSSSAALIGSAGQTNYAAANCYLDALAHYRRARGLVALSLNWSLWTQTGLAVKREVVQAGAALGAIPITPERGMAVLERAIASNQTQVVVLPLDVPLLRKTIGSRRPPTLLRDLLRPAGRQVDNALPSEDLVSRYVATYSGAPTAERAVVLVEFTRRRMGELLNLDPSWPIPDDQALLDLGLDSLIGLQLKNDLQTLTDKTLPATLFFDCPTLADLAQYFQKLPAEVTSASDAQPVRERILA